MRRDAHVSRVLGMGMSKRGNAYVTVTGASLQFLTKKPLPPPLPPLGAIAHVVIIIEE